MKIDKAIKLKNNKMREIVKLFKEAERKGYSCIELNMNINKINKKLPEDTPIWIEFYLLGCKDALYENLYEDKKIVFCGLFIDGAVFSLDNTQSDYYVDHGYENTEIIKTAFLWRNNGNNFTEWVSFRE